ncbi:FG-GAP repeat protein [Rhodothalassium salexigens DSM 2132]|uniref:FG-GAP repeat protein n=1 Tax=Rhodothalassium salexigens DSM 2132 TaxID=1188247 RepID=A0A4R2P5I1_RHOSA|nr:phage tail protein [Rhodothalassium salexigens]MBB4212765.1 hypothetical protein [Rhodothalassium salexigens DSM 2132]MBK1638968.1 hypothetical protein [Rhodothalassium salexigens DSM 2132]TCP30043.1 FG-GAP repeat protein [Rhodothalassium salexigens DSM 2132]
MADFPGLILTRAGRQILTRALIGQPLTFTRAAVGTGQVPADAEGLTALVDERRSLAIAKMDTPGDGTASVEVILTNAGVEQGFFVREIGLFARDPATDEDRLYAYANAGDRSDFLPAASGATMVEQIIRLITVIDQAETVTAEISDSLVLATQADLDALRDQTAETLDTLRQAALGRVSLDGPGTVMPGARHRYTITDYHSLAVYEASASLGTLTRDGATLTLDVPADAAPGALDLTVTRDGAAQTVTLAVGETSIAQPTMATPAEGASDVGAAPLLATTPFGAYPANADTHASTDWQVATDPGFADLVWESLADTEALTSVSVPAGALDTATTYHVRARHHGAALGASPWSPTITFGTADSFVPKREVAKLTGSNVYMDGRFGTSVAINRTGTVLVMGAPYTNSPRTDAGSYYIFERGSDGAWAEVLTNSPGGTTSYIYLGRTVAISGAGDLVLAGAPRTGDRFGNSNIGNVYVSQRRGDGSWWQYLVTPGIEIKQFFFGSSLAVSGDGTLVAVGAPGARDQGRVYLYTTPPDAKLEEMDILHAPGVPVDGHFGQSLAIDQDAETLLVGAPGEENGGAVHVFERRAAWTPTATLVLQDGASSFGAQVAVDGSGTYAVISSASATYVFERSSPNQSDWVQVTKVTDPDGNDVRGVLSLSADAQVAVIANSIFERTGSSSWRKVADLALGGEISEFGDSALSADGKTVAVSNVRYDGFTGAVHIFE